MRFFREISHIYPKIKILILGPYIYEKKLGQLVQFLKQKGFSNTYLAKERTTPINKTNNTKNIYNEVIELMENSDFNVFYLFDNSNDSVIVELTKLISDKNFRDREYRIYILAPFNYNYTMVDGMISDSKIICFNYQDESQVYQATLNFIRRNIRNIKKEEFL